MEKDDRKWEVIESEYLIKRPWLTARRDRVKLPTGVEIPEYYILEYPDWVNVIAITCEGQFVMVRQYRHGIRQTRMTISGNASTMTNMTHCYLATDVEPISTQHLEDTEDLSMHLLSREEVKTLLVNDEVKQALMAAPLWKYFALYDGE